MRLESAESLRDELVNGLLRIPPPRAQAAEWLERRAVGSTAEPEGGGGGSMRTVMRRISATTTRRRTPRPSVGLTLGRRDGDYRLSVRIAFSHLMTSQPVAQIIAAAHGEVDVKVSGIPRAQGDSLRGRCRPVRIGCSVAHEKFTAGTVSCFVLLDDDPAVHLVSSNHVLVVHPPTESSLVLQPGPLDGGGPSDGIGEVTDVVPLRFRQNNDVDVALCRLSPDVRFDSTAPTGINGSSGVAEPVSEMAVEKVGRTTGHTAGIVSEFGTVVLDIAYPGHRFASLQNQVVIDPLVGAFSQGGDSGALIHQSPGGSAVAMLNGGFGDGSSFASPVSVVLGKVGARITG